MKLMKRSSRIFLLFFIVFAFSFNFLLKYFIDDIKVNSQDQSNFQSNLGNGHFVFHTKMIKTKIEDHVKKSEKLREKFSKMKINIENINEKQRGKYLINTPECKIIDLPLYDDETLLLYTNIDELKCDRKSLIKINRFNETSIQLNWTEVGYKPFCYHRQLSRGWDDYHVKYGK